MTVAGFPPGRAREYGIDDVVEELGQVPHEMAVGLMMNASALYLPVSKGIYEKASLPGKLFDYLGSGRPIIASSLPDSEVTAVLSSVGGNCVVAPGDIRGLAEAIEKLSVADGLAAFSERIPEASARYERSSLTKNLAALLDRISRKA